MIRVAVGGDDYLEPVTPKLGCKGNANLMGGLSIYLTFSKRLVPMKTYSPVCFPLHPFRVHELLRSRLHTVHIDAGHILALLGFHFVCGILKYALDFMELSSGSLRGLFRVSCIVDNPVHSSLDGPD